MFTKARHWSPSLAQTNPVHNSHLNSLKSVFVSPSHLRVGFKVVSFLQVSSPKPYTHALLSPPIRNIRLASQSIVIDLITRIKFGEYSSCGSALHTFLQPAIISSFSNVPFILNPSQFSWTFLMPYSTRKYKVQKYWRISMCPIILIRKCMRQMSTQGTSL